MPTYHIQFTNGDNTEVVTDKPIQIDERTVRVDIESVPFWCPIERVQFIKMTQGDSPEDYPYPTLTGVIKDLRRRVDVLERPQFTETQRQEVADMIKRLRGKPSDLPTGI